MGNDLGVKSKYDVYRAERPVPNCFVLTPTQDAHSREALLAYADSCELEHPKLSSELRAWVSRIEEDLYE